MTTVYLRSTLNSLSRQLGNDDCFDYAITMIYFTCIKAYWWWNCNWKLFDEPNLPLKVIFYLKPPYEEFSKQHIMFNLKAAW